MSLRTPVPGGGDRVAQVAVGPCVAGHVARGGWNHGAGPSRSTLFRPGTQLGGPTPSPRRRMRRCSASPRAMQNETVAVDLREPQNFSRRERRARIARTSFALTTCNGPAGPGLVGTSPGSNQRMRILFLVAAIAILRMFVALRSRSKAAGLGGRAQGNPWTTMTRPERRTTMGPDTESGPISVQARIEVGCTIQEVVRSPHM